jgi:hypothetical protein
VSEQSVPRIRQEAYMLKVGDDEVDIDELRIYESSWRQLVPKLEALDPPVTVAEMAAFLATPEYDTWLSNAFRAACYEVFKGRVDDRPAAIVLTKEVSDQVRAHLRESLDRQFASKAPLTMTFDPGIGPMPTFGGDAREAMLADLGTTVRADLDRLATITEKVKDALACQRDDTCWMDICHALADVVGVPFDPKMLPRERMLGNCAHYVDCLLAGHPYVPDAEALAAYEAIRGDPYAHDNMRKIAAFFHDHVPRLLGVTLEGDR